MKSIAGPVSKRGIIVYPTPLVIKDTGVVDIPVNPPSHFTCVQVIVLKAISLN